MNAPTLKCRQDIVAALRRGTVPRQGLEHLAVGVDRFEAAIDEELARAATGAGIFKAVRGGYGAGKSFFGRWLQHRAQQAGFATAEVQICETGTPLYKMETIYRTALEHLSTKEWGTRAFRPLIERWFYSLEEEVRGRPNFPVDDREKLVSEVGGLLEARLKTVSETQPQFSAALRAMQAARAREEVALAEGLAAWLTGQPNIAAKIKHAAGLKGDIDHAAAGGFLRGLLEVLKQTGRKGLVLVLDEVETIQRMRTDSREKSLNALRQLIDELESGRYPGLYVLITGTPDFFDGPQGIKRLPPLEQRVHVDFPKDPRHDSSRAVQLRLQSFDLDRLNEVGRKVRDLYPSEHRDRIDARLPDAVIAALAAKVSGALGDRVGVAPRLFLKKLVGELLDRVEEHPDFDPAQHSELTLSSAEMTPEECEVAKVERSADDIALEIAQHLEKNA